MNNQQTNLTILFIMAGLFLSQPRAFAGPTIDLDSVLIHNPNGEIVSISGATLDFNVKLVP